MTLSEDDIKYIESIVDEKISNLTPINSNSKPKKERKKSEWQIFLGPCMKTQPKEKGMGEKVKECAVEYRKAKTKTDTETVK